MTIRTPTVALLVASSFVLVSADVRCSEADAQRVSLALLEQRVAILEAELEATPVVIDGDGIRVGTLVGVFSHPFPFIEIDLADSLPLTARVFRSGLEFAGGGGPILYESEDCTGTSWIRGTEDFVWANRVVIQSAPSDRLIFVQQEESFAGVLVRSELSATGCATDEPDRIVSATRAIPIDIDAMFTPPFRVERAIDVP